MIKPVRIFALIAFGVAAASARPYPTGAETPQIPIGSGGTFVFGFKPDRDQNQISVVYMAIETSPGADACYLSYWPAYDTIYLVGPANEPVQSLTPGSNVTVGNSRCELSGRTAFVSNSADGEFSVGLPLTFKNSINQGTKRLWAAAIDADENSGWVQLSELFYCVRACTAPSNVPPVAQPISPSTRVGSYEVFNFDYSDGNGASDLSAMQVLINSGLDSAGACYFSFDALAAGGRGVLYLVNDPGGGGPVTVDAVEPGQNKIATSAQCSINGANFSTVRNSSTISLTMGITLNSAGPRNIYMAAQDVNAANSGWIDRGDWAGPAAYQPISILVPTACGNAAACTEYEFSISKTSPTPKITLYFRDVGPSLITYTNVVVTLFRANTTVCSVSAGETATPLGSVVGTVVRTPYSNTQAQYRRNTPFNETWDETTVTAPGNYFAHLTFNVSAPPNILAVHRIYSNCIRLGDVPQITGVRDNISGQYDAIERGAQGGNLELYGWNFAGVSSSAISPSTGIAPWNILGVYPANYQVNIGYSSSSTASTGPRSISLSNALGASPPRSISVVDPSPVITGVSPDRPWQAGETITVSLSGKGFGSQPLVSLQVRDGTDETLCLGGNGVNLLPPSTPAEQDGLIRFSKSVPSNSPGCQFDIVVTSRGVSGTFLTGPGSSPKQQSDSRAGSVNANVTVLPLKIFIVHGIGDSASSMGLLAANLAAVLPGASGSDGGFVIDHDFQYVSTVLNGCDELPVAASKLANYVISKTADYQRVAFIGHSMGGLIIRRMLSDRMQHIPAFRLRIVRGLATLGTPHLGYPYLPIDPGIKCGIQATAMESHLAGGGSLDSANVLTSDFLRTLRSSWRRTDFSDKFFVAGGRACSAATRSFYYTLFPVPLAWTNGCRAANPYSDGVVCHDSAVLAYPLANIHPTHSYGDQDREFQHGPDIGVWGANVLCPNTPGARSIINPPLDSPLFQGLVGFINAL